MKFLRYVLFAILAIGIFSCTELPDGQVKVDGGIIQGTVTEELTIYKGIPFAAPLLAICDGKRLNQLCPGKALNKQRSLLLHPCNRGIRYREKVKIVFT